MNIMFLFQIYFSPLTLEQVVKVLFSPINKICGQRLQNFVTEEKKVDIKFKMEGPLFIVPESRENPKFLAIDMGKISADNMFGNDGHTENLLVNIQEGQVFTGTMGPHQNIELLGVISDDLSCKMDIKIERKASILKHSNIVSVEDISCNIDPSDVLLMTTILHHNILKLKVDLGMKVHKKIILFY